MRPLAIELFAGLHGWGAGLAAAGFRVVGFDITDMPRLLGHPVPEHCSLVLQDVRTLHGSQFRNAHLIVASPPCQRYSFMAMPFSRGKRLAAEIRADESGEKLRDLNALFDACFRIQREASEAAGRYIPMVVENVRGAQPWVGRARWSYGSYYLWGDVPAIMPFHGGEWKGFATRFDDAEMHQQRGSYGTDKRRAWSAQNAKIPFALAEHIGRVYYPHGDSCAQRDQRANKTIEKIGELVHN